MNLEKVKEYFKDAKQVKCLVDNKIYNIDVMGDFENFVNQINFEFIDHQRGQSCVALYVKDELAEIISYKEEEKSMNLEEVKEHFNFETTPSWVVLTEPKNIAEIISYKEEEKSMNLEQVKEHFKNAKQVKCLCDNGVYNIDVEGEFNVQYHESGNDFCKFVVFGASQQDETYCVLFEDDKLAEIISKKEPEKSEYPRVMLVSDDEENWWPRVVFMEKNGKFIAWNYAKTIEEAGEVCKTTVWLYAKELPKEIEVTKEEIAKWKGCDVEQLIIK